jgi:hypothetical protein
VAKVCIFLITVALIAGTVGCDGDGLQNLEIRTWYDLDAIRDNLGGSYILMNDLDSTTLGYEELASPTANGGKGWQPIGAWGDRFTGSLDGQGYEIRDLFIARPDDDWVGLFSIVDDTGVVKNVGVVNADVLGRNRVGALVGQNEGSVVNCYSTGSVGGEGRVGGLVGLNYRFRDQPDPFAIIGDPYSEVGIISDSYSAASVSGEWGIGGLVGSNDDILSRSYSTGDVTGHSLVGGLVGSNGGPIRDCYYVGSVTGDVSVGGLVGACGGTADNVGTVSNSYSSGSVTGDVKVGGLVGDNDGTVSNSYSTGNVIGNSNVGGLVGWNYHGTVSNSYSTGSVTGKYEVGGLVGDNYEGTVSNSYSTGNVTGTYGTYKVGGLVGWNWGTVSNSHYNYDEVLINGENIITIGALFDEDFDEWLANDKFLDINDRLSQENGYYLINDVRDFKELLAFGQDSSLNFRLKNDLDLAAEPNFYIPYFAGEFDGNGHKISDLSFYFVSPVGLFGCLASGGKVTDLGVENVNVTGDDYVGGLVGLNWGGTVSNSYSSGTVTGDNYVGGLVGHNDGTVSSSYSTGNIAGELGVGGLMGENCGDVSNSYSTGSVTGGYYVGGLVGVNLETINNSYSTGSVTGNDYVGGLVGSNYLLGNNGTVSSSFWDTETSGQATSAGGTGKTTVEMQDIATFSGATWDICKVDPDQTNPTYIWNIVDEQTYPFLSWEW